MFDISLSEKEDLAGVIMVIACLTTSPALLMFVDRSDLFSRLDVVRLFLLVIGMGFGTLLAAMFLVAGARDGFRKRKRYALLLDGVLTPPVEAPKDWTLLYEAGLVTNAIILLLAVWSYWHRIRIGATLVAADIVMLTATFVIQGLFASWPLRVRGSKR